MPMQKGERVVVHHCHIYIYIYIVMYYVSAWHLVEVDMCAAARMSACAIGATNE